MGVADDADAVGEVHLDAPSLLTSASQTFPKPSPLLSRWAAFAISVQLSSDGKPDPPDSLRDFPEEFEQRPGAPPRDQARRAQRRPASDSARERIEEMKRKLADLARPKGAREEGDA